MERVALAVLFSGAFCAQSLRWMTELLGVTANMLARFGAAVGPHGNYRVGASDDEGMDPEPPAEFPREDPYGLAYVAPSRLETFLSPQLPSSANTGWFREGVMYLRPQFQFAKPEVNSTSGTGTSMATGVRLG